MLSDVRRTGTLALAAALVAVGLPVLPLLPASPAHAISDLHAIKDDALIIDNNGDGLVDPGDTLRYTVTLTNAGTTDATDVVYSDVIDRNTTMVAGSVRTTPIARNDFYSALGNVSITVPAASGVLINDEDPDGAGGSPDVTVSAAPSSSVNGGAVSVATDGSFTYDPPVGFEGLDSFVYSVVDSEGETDSANVSFSVSDMVWFIDNSSVGADTGTYGDPFTSVSSFNASAGVSPGDAIFIYQGSGPYVDGIALQNDQALFGQGVDLLAELTGVGIFPPTHSDLTTSPAFPNRPTLTNAAGDGITLAAGNTVRGLDIGGTSGTAIVGSFVGTAVIDTMAIQSPGGGVDIQAGAAAVTLDSIATSGGTTGISLATLAGSFSVTGASSVDNAPGTSVVINGGSVSVSLADLSITNRNGTGIHITGATGTSVTFGDVDIANPNGATGYGIRVDGSSANVSLDSADISNTVQGTPETDAGSDGVPDSDGDGDAIFLSANSGSFSLTGTGTQGDAGTLSNIADHGVDSRSVSGTITLNDLSIQGVGVGSSNPATIHPDGIFAYNLSGSLSLDGALISEFDALSNSRGIEVVSVGTDFTEIRVENTPIQNTGALGGDDAFLLDARGAVSGAIVIADDNAVGAAGHSSTWSGLSGYGVQVLTGNSGGSGTVTAEVRNIELRDAVNPGGLGGIEFAAQGTAVLDVDIVGNTLEQLFNANALGFGMVHFAAFGSSSLTANVASNTLDGANAIAADDGRRGIVALTGDLPGENVQVFDLNIDNNTINGTAHEAVYVDLRGDALSGSGPGEVRITDNSIGSTTPVAQSGREGIELRVRDTAKTLNLLVDNNTVRNADNGSSDETVDIDAEDSTLLNATVTNNTFTSANASGGLDEFEAETDDSGSTMCLDLRDNTASEGGGSGNGTFHADAAAGSTFDLNEGGNSTAVDKTGVIGSVGSCVLPTAASSIAAATSDPTDTSLDTTASDDESESLSESSETSEARPPTTLKTAAAEEPVPTELLSPAMVTESPSGFTLTLGSLNPGQIVVITFDVEINNPVGPGGTLVCNQGLFESSNHADLWTDDPSTGAIDDPTCTNVEANPPDLQLVKDDGGVDVQAGGTIEYTLTFNNVGGGDATGVIITDTVPTNATFNAAASTAGWSCADGDPAGTTCTLPVGSLPAGGAGIATFAATVDRPIASGVGFIVNAAAISDDGAGGEDPNPGDNFSTAVTPLDAAPDLTIDKDDAGGAALPGSTIVYSLSYANVGPQGAIGVVISDTVPANTTFNSGASTAGWSCADGVPAGTICTLPVGAINGDSATTSVDFAVTVDAAPPAGTVISNTATITDDGSNGPDENPADNTDTEETPVDQPPAADAGGPYVGDEGQPVPLDGSGSTDDLGIALYEWDCTNDGIFDVSSASPTGDTCTYPDDDSYTLRLRVTDTGGQTDEDTATVSIANVAPVVSASPDEQSVQYSDYIAPVTVSASDVDADTPDDITTEWKVDGGSFTTGLPADLALSATGCSSDGTTTTCGWTIDGFADVPADDYTIRVTVADEDGGSSSIDIPVAVVPEDASVSFDAGNLVAVGVDTPGGDSDPFTLTVFVEETEPDLPAGAGMAGDISLAEVTLTLKPVGPGSPVPGICVPTGTSGTGYDGVLTVDCEFGDVPVNAYIAEVTVDGGYYTGTGEDVLVVYDPSLGFTTGGGWFYWPDTADEATGYAGDKTNVGYTMSYNKKGQKVKGNLVMIRHLADGSIYRIKSNALSGLALGSGNDGDDFGWASFSGKATYIEPGWADAVGNHTFIVYVEDHGTPAADADRFWIEIRDKDGAVIPDSSMLMSADANAVLLGGGNIVVPHDGGKGKGGGKP